MEERHERMGRTLVETIVLTSEICGQPLSYAAADLLSRDLAHFDEAVVLNALARCRLLVQGSLRVADIIRHVDDGRPSTEEAWAMLPASEQASVVWTEEMARSWNAAAPFMDAGDLSEARQVFSETYSKAVLQSRVDGLAVRWLPSLGSDAKNRSEVLLEAVKKGRLSMKQIEPLLPPEKIEEAANAAPVELKRRRLH